jgi:hypothetical protein
MILVGLALAQLAAAGADAAAAMITSRSDSVRSTAWAMAAVVVLDLAIHGQRRAEPVDRSLLDARPKAADELRAGERSLVLLSRGIWASQLPSNAAEARKWLVENDLLEPDRGLLFSVRDLGGYTPLVPRRMLEYLRVAVRRPELLARAGVSRVVTGPIAPGTPRLPEPLTTRSETPTHVVYELGALSRVRTVFFASWADDDLRALETSPATRAVTNDPVLASELEHNLPSPYHGLGAGPRIEVDDDEYVEIAAHCPEEDTAGGLVVLADAWYPGWIAEVDDKRVEVLRVDHALRGVRVPPGDHRVRLRYEPASFRLGKRMSLATAALWAVVLALALLRPRAPGAAAPPAP